MYPIKFIKYFSHTFSVLTHKLDNILSKITIKKRSKAK